MVWTNINQAVLDQKARKPSIDAKWVRINKISKQNMEDLKKLMGDE
jgi:hypothetical protein